MIDIRDLQASDERAWRGLWQAYLDFYQTVLSEEVTDTTWARLLDPASKLFGRGAWYEGALAGFAIAIVHPSTWSIPDICYLEDLYVEPAVRGRGVGRALIEDLAAIAWREGWTRLYWHTEDANARARALYDSFRPADPMVRYTLRPS